MSKYRNALPHLSDRIFLTDGGLETTLVFHEGIDLPHFAAITLVGTEAGEAVLNRYYEAYARIALKGEMGFMLDTATWRASPDWAPRLGYGADGLASVNRRSVDLVAAIRDRFETKACPMVLNGAIGPRGDGYVTDNIMTVNEARRYHMAQIGMLARAGVDMVTCYTINYAEEATGIVLAAASEGVPVAVSFTLETDGRLPSGMSLRQAITEVENATLGAPLYYMINCAHPTHFEAILETDEPWVKRIRGLRANASTRSHAELDAAPDLDAGDPVALGRHYRALRDRHSQLTVLGGCCGTDCRHVEQISYACMAA